MEEITIPQMNLNAILYTRVSSDQQVSNTSLDQQERIGLDYALRNNLNIKRIFREEGESAMYADRTKLQEALRYCGDSHNNIKVFLVYKLDRFSRSLENHVAIRSLLSSYNVKLVSMTEQVDESPNGRLMEHILASFAQFDNEIRRERVINGTIARLKDGYWTTQLPPAYKRGEEKHGSIRLVVRDEERWDIISSAWEWFSTGNYSQAQILSFLDDHNFQTVSGRRPDKNMVGRMFRNRFYTGRVVVPKHNIDVEGRHPAMVTEQKFNQVQEVLAESEKNKNRIYLPFNPDFVLNKLFKCGSCGFTMSGSYSRGKSGKRFGYYACSNRDCGNRERISSNVAENSYLGILSSITPSDQVRLDLKEYMIPKLKELQSVKASEVKSLRVRLIELEDRLKKIDNRLDVGYYSVEEAKIKKQETEFEISQLLPKIEIKSVNRYEVEEMIDYTFNFLEHLCELWKSLDAGAKARMNNFIFPEGIRIEKKQFSNTSISPLFKYLEDIKRGQFPYGGQCEPILEHLKAFLKLFRSLNLSLNF